MLFVWFEFYILGSKLLIDNQNNKFIFRDILSYIRGYKSGWASGHLIKVTNNIIRYSIELFLMTWLAKHHKKTKNTSTSYLALAHHFVSHLCSFSSPSSLPALSCSSSASPAAILSLRMPLSISMLPSSLCSASTCWPLSSDCSSAFWSRSDCSARRRRYSVDSACEGSNRVRTEY